MKLCSTCDHFRNTTGDLAVGECRRYPPTLVAMNGPGGFTAASSWPPVQRSASCGEWTPQPFDITEVKAG